MLMQRQHLDPYRHSAPPVLQTDPNGPFKKADAADARVVETLSHKQNTDDPGGE